MGEDATFQIRPQFSLNMKRERMLAGACALEKGFQVIDQDPIAVPGHWPRSPSCNAASAKTERPWQRE